MIQKIQKNFQNHQSWHGAQKCFHKQVNSLYSTFKKMGNPFLYNFPELVTLDSRNCMDESVVKALYALEDIGMKQYQEFFKSVLKDCTHSIVYSSKFLLDTLFVWYAEVEHPELVVFSQLIGFFCKITPLLYH